MSSNSISAYHPASPRAGAHSDELLPSQLRFDPWLDSLHLIFGRGREQREELQIDGARVGKSMRVEMVDRRGEKDGLL